jgi:hypothetical protein
MAALPQNCPHNGLTIILLIKHVNITPVIAHGYRGGHSTDYGSFLL